MRLVRSEHVFPPPARSAHRDLGQFGCRCRLVLSNRTHSIPRTPRGATSCWRVLVTPLMSCRPRFDGWQDPGGAPRVSDLHASTNAIAEALAIELDASLLSGPAVGPTAREAAGSFQAQQAVLAQQVLVRLSLQTSSLHGIDAISATWSDVPLACSSASADVAAERHRLLSLSALGVPLGQHGDR